MRALAGLALAVTLAGCAAPITLAESEARKAAPPDVEASERFIARRDCERNHPQGMAFFPVRVPWLLYCAAAK
jgi:hypothetical protein